MKDDNILFVLVVIILSIIFQVLNVIDLLSKECQLKEQRDYIKKILDFQKDQLNQQESLLRETYKFRHDINNHMKAVEYMAHESDNKEISEYINNLYGEFISEMNIRKTGNQLADAIISHYDVKIKEIGGHIILDVSFPEKMKLKDKDIVTIMTNLLQNSFDAIKCSEEDKEIRIEIEYDKNHLYLKISNPFKDNKEVFGSLVHGYGIKNVISVVEAGKGTYNVVKFKERDCDIYSTEIMLEY